MKKNMSSQTRILFFFTIFVLALCTIITVLSVRKSLEVASAIFTRQGVSLVKRAAAVIDGDKFEALSESLDEEDPFYEHTRRELLAMRNEASVHYLYTIAPGGKTDFRYIVDGSGEKGSEVFSHLGAEVDPEDIDSSFVRTWDTAAGQSGSLEKSEWGYLVTVYEPIMNSRGSMVGIVGCDFDAQFLYDSVKSQIIEHILLGALFAIAGVGIMFLLVRPIFVRLGRIREILTVITQGEGNLSARIAIRENDEIGVMANLFNQTMDKISGMVSLIKDQAVNLSNVGNELSENMKATAEAVTEITGNIQNIKGQAVNQSASVTQTNDTMEKVMKNIDRLNSQVEAQTESVSQSSTAIEQMLANIQSVTATLVKNAENVERLTSASDLGRTSLEGVARDIQGIARESEGILEINAVMQNIASQTNLLSMNAAIEAAHAGETGRGFAVVADEIRKLAESSSKQSKTISAVLKKIKASIDMITQSTATVMEKFQNIDTEVRTVSQQESNIRSAMEEQGAGSKQIMEAMSRLQEITLQVKDGSAEMLAGSKEVITEGKKLAAATEKIAGGINEITSGADYINSAIERVHTISDNNREHINALAREVEKFKGERTSYVWDKTFAVGHELIDSQHQELFTALNSLIAACGNKSREEFKRDLDFLAGYVVKHFSDEEELQKQYGYADYPNHKKMHEAFTKAAVELSAQWLARGPSGNLIPEIHANIGDWLISHIKAQDVKVGATIRSKKS